MTSKSLTITASAIAGDTAAMTSIARYAAKTVMQKVKESVKAFVLTPLSPLPSGRTHFLTRLVEATRTRDPKKKLRNGKSFVFFSGKEGLVKKTKKSFESTKISRDAKHRAFKPKFLHATDSHF